MSELDIEYRAEFNIMDFVDKYAERINRIIDEQTLASVEHKLVEYGYVKVVRCSDCQHYKETAGLSRFNLAFCKFHSGPCEPSGYCAWGDRKEGGDD